MRTTFTAPECTPPHPPRAWMMHVTNHEWGLLHCVRLCRYQIIAGVLEQRMLEPLLASKPGLLSVACLMARTANTFLGSLLWVDFARLTGLQPKQTADPSNLSDQAKVAAA